MQIINLLHFSDRAELRGWFESNHGSEKECWVVTYIAKYSECPAIRYVEVVEETLCFGWIDSTKKKLSDGRLAQRLSPRRKGIHWSELNIQRCYELERRTLMTNAGRRVFESALL